MDSGKRYIGQDRVIAAIPYIVAQGHDVEYVVVGERDDCVRLESLAREVRVSDRVRFLGSTDLIAFLEAMVSGTPTLGLSVAGTTDALADGELGTIVSEPEIPPAIVRILAKPKPDPVALAEATRARFGRSQFAAGVRAALSRLMEAS